MFKNTYTIRKDKTRLYQLCDDHKLMFYFGSFSWKQTIFHWWKKWGGTTLDDFLKGIKIFSNTLLGICLVQKSSVR